MTVLLVSDESRDKRTYEFIKNYNKKSKRYDELRSKISEGLKKHRTVTLCGVTVPEAEKLSKDLNIKFGEIREDVCCERCIDPRNPPDLRHTLVFFKRKSLCIIM